MHRKKGESQYKIKKLALFISLSALTIIAITFTINIINYGHHISKVEAEKVTSKTISSSKKVEQSKAKNSPDSSNSSKIKTSDSDDKGNTINKEITEKSPVEPETSYETKIANAGKYKEQTAVVTETAYNVQSSQTQVQNQASNYNNNYNNVTTNTNLSNGNTAGETGSYAAAQMAVATGVDQATWEHIIARESNGQVNARNASGASGLFQTMPGWGSTATVQDQINSAINAYKSQGLAAWGY